MKKQLFSMLLIFSFLFHFFFATPAVALSKASTVIVVGAGISGITTAKTLHEAGIKDILILEASDRIGGRMRKAKFTNLTVEMGANWMFGGGPVTNPILELASKINLRLSQNDYTNLTSNTYKQEGGLYPKALVEEIDDIATARDDFCASFSRNLSTLNSDEDVSILAAQRIFGKEPKTPLEQVVDYYHNDYEDGEPPKVTSLKHTYPRNEFEDHGDEEYFVADPRGFETIVKYLARQFLSSSDPRLKLNKVVTEIKYTDEGVTIKTEDDSTYRSKYAVVSASLGVLQSDLIKFKPQLPLWKRVAIADFSMTIYTKIFLRFPYIFWPTGEGTEFFLYTHVRRGYYPLWQHLENEYPGSNVLFVTVTADESRRVEKLSDDEIKAEVMEILRKLFGESIPDPIAMFVPRWGQERFYRGSYSNWPDSYNQQRKNQLADPVGRVYFTGEHTSNRYLGYVTGAYLAGLDTGKDLLKCIKENTCKGQTLSEEGNVIKMKTQDN